jgi:hypothetical protein
MTQWALSCDHESVWCCENLKEAIWDLSKLRTLSIDIDGYLHSTLEVLKGAEALFLAVSCGSPDLR